MYIKNYDNIPLWAWGKDLEDKGTNKDTLDFVELKHRQEVDLLCDLDFISGELIE